MLLDSHFGRLITELKLIEADRIVPNLQVLAFEKVTDF